MDLERILDLVDNDQRLEKLVRAKAKKFKEELIDLIDRKGESKIVKEDDSLKSKISHELDQIRNRLKRIQMNSYKEVARVTRVKLARLVDTLEKMVDEESIGMNEFNAYVEHIEGIFNPMKKDDFSMKGIRNAFETLICDMNDDLGISDDE